MRAGRPTKAGTSKASMACIKMISIAEKEAGRINGNVMWYNVEKIPEPDIVEDSSKAISIERNEAAIIRKTKG